MIKFIAFVIIVALRIIYHPVHSKTGTAPFAHPTPSPVPSAIGTPAKLLDIYGNFFNNKIYLCWTVGENETADQFEVEKSMDGKTFKMAALVFGTDKPYTESYQFYEKAGNQKVLYRIRLINKDRKTEYSPVVEMNPFI
jgi:hypothetical protein